MLVDAITVSRHNYDLVNNLVLWGAIVLLVLWISAIVGAVHYDGYFQPARVSKVLMWVLLILGPTIGTIFCFVVRPRLKRARDAALATD